MLILLIYLRGWDSFILFLCRFIAINLCRREAILRGSTLVADLISPQSPLPCPSFPIHLVSTTATRAIETFKTTYIQLFRESLSEKMCTRQSWKVICYMINTFVSNDRSCRTYFCCSPSALGSQTYVRGFPCPFTFLRGTVHSKHPQYLSGLSCALCPTTFLEIVVYLTFQVLV